MAIGKTVKGITIEFNGDTTKLGKALRDVDKETRSVDKSLKEVNRALKFNPSDTELLTQKQKLLGDRVKETKEKLDLLKKTQAELDDDPSVDKSSQDYMELRREIIETESKLKHFEDQVKELSNIKLTALGNQMKKVGDKMKAAGTTATQYVTTPIAGGFAAAAKVTMDFDSAMSQVAATMGKTTEEMETEQVTVGDFSGSLRDLAIEMGSKTAFSATQAAEALNYMALAGYDAQTSADMLPSVLNLAAAGNMDLASASDMVTDSQSALGLSLDETSTLIDQMAKTSSKSNTSVEQLGSAILTVGGTAKMMKGGTEELNAVLGVLADNGIKGSEGGTALRNILLSLGSPTDKAAQKLEQLGIEVYDSEGKMKDMRDLMPELAGALDKLSDEDRTKAIAAIFNKRDLKSVNALLGTSTERWDDLSSAIGDSGGAAEQMADTQLDNLQGSLTILKSALEGLAIHVGDVLTPYIKKFAEWLTTLADKFNGLSPKTQTAIVALGAVAAAIGPVLVVLGVLMSSIGKILLTGPKIISMFSSVGKAFKLLTTILTANPWMLVAAAAIAAIVLIVKNWDKIKEFFAKLWEAIKVVAKAAWDGIKNMFKAVFAAIKLVITTYINIWKKIFKTAFGIIKNYIVNPIKNAVRSVKERFDHLKLAVGMRISLLQKKVKEVFDKIKSHIIDPIKNAKAKVVETIGALKDALSEKIDTIKSTVSDKFKAIKDAILKPIRTARDKIKEIIDKIKGFFDFDFELPHIKLPHFSIKPPGWQFSDLLEGSIPSLGIDWYAKGGIFNSPQVVGVGDVRGGEAALPLEPFWERFDKMADRIVEAVQEGESTTRSGEAVFQGNIIVDGQVIAKVITPIVNRSLQRQAAMDGRNA